MENTGTVIKAIEADKYIPSDRSKFEFADYSRMIAAFDQSGLESYGKGSTPLWYYMLGLAGETGEFTEKVIDFSFRSWPGLDAIHEMGKELGDVLWYAIRSFYKIGVKPYDYLLSVTFDDYQEHVGVPTFSVTHYSQALSAKVGRTVDKVKKYYRNGQTDVLTFEQELELARMLAEVVRMIAFCASSLGIKLSDIAAWNVEKLADRTRRNVIRAEGDNR
jgi:NTP pyrophosphatase (non-canonical NTP hydrolase)